MKDILAFIEKNRQRYLDELFSLLRIPSISADPAYDAETRRAGQWCVDRLKKMGFEHCALQETIGKPVVVADWLHAGADKPTILVYGHYDVQPAVPLEKWTTPPFEPVIRDGKIYARGADDNKGQLCTQLFALEALLTNTGSLPVNIKVLIEGEEESGGKGSDDFVKKQSRALACDAVAISDTSWYNAQTPTICSGLRGICYMEVKVKGPNRDVHSGVYGGQLQNPINALAKLIASLHDDRGAITIPNFYQDVLPLADEQRREYKSLGDDEPAIRADLHVPALWGENGYTARERNWDRPALDANGIWGGYAGAGAKTIIPSEAGCKISVRLVANQQPDRVAQSIKQHLERHCPSGVTVTVDCLHGAVPVNVPRENPYLQAAVRAFAQSLGKQPLLVKMGASIPITAAFLSQLQAPSIMVGYGLESNHIHSPDEHFPVEFLSKGIVTNVYLYQEFARVKRG